MFYLVWIPIFTRMQAKTLNHILYVFIRLSTPVKDIIGVDTTVGRAYAQSMSEINCTSYQAFVTIFWPTMGIDVWVGQIEIQQQST